MEYPDEIAANLHNFTDSIEVTKTALEPIMKTSRSDLIRNATALDTLKIDLTAAFAVNSLYWAFLSSQGVSPKENAVKQELDRIKTYMGKVKEMEDRKKAPRLTKEAAKRFISHALYDLGKDVNNKRARRSTEHAEKGERPDDVIVIDDDEADDVITIDDDEDEAEEAAASVVTSHGKTARNKRRRLRRKKERREKMMKGDDEKATTSVGDDEGDTTAQSFADDDC